MTTSNIVKIKGIPFEEIKRLHVGSEFCFIKKENGMFGMSGRMGIEFSPVEVLTYAQGYDQRLVFAYRDARRM